jgi:hypothetical protein
MSGFPDMGHEPKVRIQAVEIRLAEDSTRIPHTEYGARTIDVSSGTSKTMFHRLTRAGGAVYISPAFQRGVAYRFVYLESRRDGAHAVGKAEGFANGIENITNKSISINPYISI